LRPFTRRLAVAIHKVVDPMRAPGRPAAPAGVRGVRRGTPAVALLTGLVATAAVLLYAGPVSGLAAPDGPRLHWALLAVLYTLTAAFPVRFELRRDTHTVDLIDIPLVLGLHLTGPAGLVLARLAGTVVTLLRQGTRGLKLAFNLSLAVLEASVALVLFAGVFGGREAGGAALLLATFAAVLVTDLLSGLLISAAIALHSGVADLRGSILAMAAGVAAAVANTSLGLIAVILVVNDPGSIWLLAVVAAVLVLAYRAYASLRGEHERLERLHSFTRAVAESEPGAVAAAILTEARDVLRAQRAGIVRLPLAGAGAVRTEAGPDGILTAPVDPADPDAELLGRLVAQAPIALGPPDDVMAAPLRDSTGIVGILLVAGRLGDVSHFAQADLRLLETLAGQASIALEKGQLFESLRRDAAERAHQATHDALTGLPNRSMFGERVRRQMTEPGREAAVLLIGLDRFKDVNDTLGHHIGDLVLREVAARLRRDLPPEYVVARLAGDEFAVMIPDVADRYLVLVLAGRVHEIIDRPYSLEGLDLEIAGSVGIAVSPDHGLDAGLLLRRADMALAAAKTAHSTIEVYSPGSDHSSARRLTLLGALRSALERHELTLHYQPKAELATGRIAGVEALLRWHHPVHGFVPPDEFIPIAESTGLIRPLALYVIDEALAQAKAWRAQGLELGLAVNLSVRNLVDPNLADAVAGLLAGHGIAPRLLTLEITEGQVMEDPDRAVALLGRLREVGVQLSIDDFGTGHSSLTYVKRLPVTEMKIDKSFVTNLAADPADEAIVRSTVTLARNLGLKLVAEGVEDRRTWDLLAAMECDVAQGYYLAKPMPADDLAAWLRDSPFARAHHPGGRPLVGEPGAG
jgi:diguanylate cyclase (GGDEF)-like protein